GPLFPYPAMKPRIPIFRTAAFLPVPSKASAPVRHSPKMPGFSTATLRDALSQAFAPAHRSTWRAAFLLAWILVLTIGNGIAQSPAPTDTTMRIICPEPPIPLIVTAQFHNFALPFHDIPTHFTHPGLLIGTEVRLNNRSTLFQQFHAGFHLNREMGHGFGL